LDGITAWKVDGIPFPSATIPGFTAERFALVDCHQAPGLGVIGMSQDVAADPNGSFPDLAMALFLPPWPDFMTSTHRVQSIGRCRAMV